MKQLNTVFKFEFLTCVKRKSFVGLCLIIVILVGGALSWPRISGMLGLNSTSTGSASTEKQTTVAVAIQNPDSADDIEKLASFLNTATEGQNYEFVPTSKASVDELKASVEDGTYSQAILLTSPLAYTRITKTVGMYDFFDNILSEALLQNYRSQALEKFGVPSNTVDDILNATITSELVQTATGKDQMQSFIFTYVLIFALYFAIIMYGNMVASSVATEKSTRAMELLITSARPTNLMFGKVFGAGLAGLTQLLVILGSGYLFYSLNAQYHKDNYIIQSIFGMPLNMIGYTLLFFILGFFIYAFLFAALASLVSRMEDLSSATMPVTWIFIVAFMLVMFSMSSGNVDGFLMKVASFIPLTSPMAMFARIAMGEVASWEIIVSVAILLASTILIGMLAAAIYRLGVLMYGNAPKPREIVRMLKASKKAKA